MHHVVLMTFKDESKIAPLFAALGRLQSLIPGMTSYTFGPNVSPEGLNHGYTHAFVMSFTDAKSRDEYLNHPEHEKVKSDFLPYVSQVLVLDYEM